jgi:hypothetical protein
MKVGKPSHERLVISTSESSATTTSKTTPLGTTIHLQRPTQTWHKLTGKLNWSNVKTKDMKATEVRAVKMMEQVRKEGERRPRRV